MPSRLSFWTKVPVAISFLPFYIAEQRCEASKPHLRATVRQMWEAYAISAAITLILKISIGHHRPYSNNGPYDFELLDFTLKSSQMSFPSGHTSTAFALMTVLAKRSGSFWVKSAAYILSASVAFQRMQHRKHWASDVLFGGAIGYCIGSWVVSRSRNHKVNIVMSPYDGTRAGIRINF